MFMSSVYLTPSRRSAVIVSIVQSKKTTPSSSNHSVCSSKAPAPTSHNRSFPTLYAILFQERRRERDYKR